MTSKIFCLIEIDIKLFGNNIKDLKHDIGAELNKATEKIEELMKPFATKELKVLANFLQALKKNKSLDQLLNF